MLLAIRGLRREGGYDLVHVWSTGALTAVGIAGPSRIVYSPPSLVRGRDVGWLRAMMAYRDVQVVSPTRTMHQALLRAGIAAERCRVIRPGVDFSRVSGRKEPAIRAALGLKADDYVLLAVGESTRSASHEDAVWAAAILHVLDPQYKLLIWGEGPAVGQAKAFARRISSGDLLRVGSERLGAGVEFERLLRAADLAVNTATGSVSALPVAMGMAAALPIVSTVTRGSSELLEDHHSAILVPARSPRLMAQRIMELRQDSGLQRKLCETARTEAYQYWSLTKFVEGYRNLYAQLARDETANAHGCPASPSFPV